MAVHRGWITQQAQAAVSQRCGRIVAQDGDTGGYDWHWPKSLAEAVVNAGAVRVTD
jgi:hypothetical protein